MGFIYGGPVLLMGMAVMRFPRVGGILAVTASLGLLLFSISRIMNSVPNYDRIATLIVFSISLIGSLIALAGSVWLNRGKTD
jgi:hypothetical protein